MTCLLVNTSGIVREKFWDPTLQIWLVQIGRLPHGQIMDSQKAIYCLFQS